MAIDFPGEVEGRDGAALWLSRFFRNNAGTGWRRAHSAGSDAQS